MKVLIIDDDVIDHELSTRLLEIADNTFTITSSYNGKQGVEYITDHLQKSQDLPDVILLDMRMPVLDGWGFLEEFNNLTFDSKPKPSVYILSSQEIDQNKVKDFPVAGHYAKPLNFSTISQIIRRYNEN